MYTCYVSLLLPFIKQWLVHRSQNLPKEHWRTVVWLIWYLCTHHCWMTSKSIVQSAWIRRINQQHNMVRNVFKHTLAWFKLPDSIHSAVVGTQVSKSTVRNSGVQWCVAMWVQRHQSEGTIWIHQQHHNVIAVFMYPLAWDELSDPIHSAVVGTIVHILFLVTSTSF